MVVAQVVPLVHLDSDRQLIYSIPPALLVEIGRGSLVVIPLRSRLVQGVVTGLKRGATIRKLKPIKKILTSRCVDEPTFRLAKFLVSYYRAQLGECLNAILPS